MRVVDLERDMSDVIPTGTTRDSEFLFDRMTRRTLALAEPGKGRRILDVASGIGQDALAMAGEGAEVVGLEPSYRMLSLARLHCDREGGPIPHWVQGWSDALPFPGASFDAVICKGAIDHFDSPELALAEMARITRPEGRVVLAIANFESLGCRASRGFDRVRERWLRRPVRRGRRHHDVPSDHFTRYELDLMREQASRWLALEVVEGVSLAWGVPHWSRVLGALPGFAAQAALRGLNALAARLPRWADVVLLAGRPRPPRSRSRRQRERASETTSR